MIVADTSAFAAILLGEADAALFADVIASSPHVLIAAPNAFELRLVMRRKFGEVYMIAVDTLLGAPQIEIASWTTAHVAAASTALTRFGGRPARLNFGDCMAYALAKSLHVPLLYKGDDFAHTDIRSALD